MASNIVSYCSKYVCSSGIVVLYLLIYLLPSTLGMGDCTGSTTVGYSAEVLNGTSYNQVAAGGREIGLYDIFKSVYLV